MSGIGRDRDQRLGRCLEQKIVDRGLVLIGDVGEGGRQGEHEVIIGNGQEFGFLLGEPGSGRRALALRAMAVTARVVFDDRVGAILERATWPPSAAVRQVSIADIAFNWPRLTCPALASRQAGPWARKISATSRTRRATAAKHQAGASSLAGFLVGILARFKLSRSRGLITSRIVLTATRV